VREASRFSSAEDGLEVQMKQKGEKRKQQFGEMQQKLEDERKKNKKSNPFIHFSISNFLLCVRMPLARLLLHIKRRRR